MASLATPHVRHVRITLRKVLGVVLAHPQDFVEGQLTCLEPGDVLYFGAKKPSKTRPFPIKTVVIWVLGWYKHLLKLTCPPKKGNHFKRKGSSSSSFVFRWQAINFWGSRIVSSQNKLLLLQLYNPEHFFLESNRSFGWWFSLCDFHVGLWLTLLVSAGQKLTSNFKRVLIIQPKQ